MVADYSYDAVIVGAGHNGLVAACYLAQAGLRVLVLEKNAVIGGATRSEYSFAGLDARISVYSYLVSLLPGKILSDLGLRFETRQRAIASYSPVQKNGQHTGLLISNVSQALTRQSFRDLTGGEREYRRYQQLQERLAAFARIIWPTLLSPLLSRHVLRARFQTREELETWEYLVEKPLAALIEDHLTDDLVRGLVFTDAKIGVPTFPEDSSLLQNKTFLYHIIGQGTGEWRVPVGGMGSLVDELHQTALAAGAVILPSAEVTGVDHSPAGNEVAFIQADQESSVTTRYILFNTSADIANRLLPGVFQEAQVEGSVFKVNMLLKRLPEMRDSRVSAQQAFTGTFHLYEGYQRMQSSYQSAQRDELMDKLPGEMYCHSLTDPSILSAELQQMGAHSLTLFGLDVPYTWFSQENARMKAVVTQRYLDGINDFIAGDIRDCLAIDATGEPCIEAKSPLDLEASLGLPRGNIFHGNLTWPFAEHDDEAGQWGVETNCPGVFLCGSSARRGGAVSGIPGHNAAMKVLGLKKG